MNRNCGGDHKILLSILRGDHKISGVGNCGVIGRGADNEPHLHLDRRIMHIYLLKVPNILVYLVFASLC